MTDQPRSPHVRANPQAWNHQTTPPANRRPYRPASETGAEQRTTTSDGYVQRWRQIGWHGQTGAFYALDERPADHEPGGWSPLWLLVDNDPPILPEETHVVADDSEDPEHVDDCPGCTTA